MKFLCLDGGGSKGIYTLGVLAEVEKAVGPLNKAFDFVYGTSTGSIIAAGIAAGLSCQDLANFYLERVGPIMKVWLASRRSAQLRAALSSVLGDRGFGELSTGLCIVAANFDDKRPLIFKSHAAAGHSMLSSFVPGFGCSLVDAVAASCAAYPFFSIAAVTTQNQGLVRAIDGGYLANNPALLAYADATEALKVPAEEVRLLSVGTGVFPIRYPKEALLQAIPLITARGMLEILFDGSANATVGVFKILASKAKVVRVHEEFSDPQLACSLFEYDVGRLGRLRAKGRDSYGKHEHAILDLLR